MYEYLFGIAYIYIPALILGTRGYVCKPCTYHRKDLYRVIRLICNAKCISRFM